MSETKSSPAPTDDISLSNTVGKRKRPQGSEEQSSPLTSGYHDRGEDGRKRKHKFDELLVDLLEVMRA